MIGISIANLQQAQAFTRYYSGVLWYFLLLFGFGDAIQSFNQHRQYINLNIVRLSLSKSALDHGYHHLRQASTPCWLETG